MLTTRREVGGPAAQCGFPRAWGRSSRRPGQPGLASRGGTGSADHRVRLHRYLGLRAPWSRRAVAFPAVRCPTCASLDDKVVDSRTTDDGTAVRRRRQCLDCTTRFTTFERLEETPLVVVKSSGAEVAFDRTKIVAGVASAAKGRPVAAAAIETLAAEVEDVARLEGTRVTSERIGRAVLEALARLDGVSALRFASVYKGFDDLADFEREIGLLTKN